MVIAREDPRQPDVIAMVAALDRYQETLYPPASNHHLDIDTLAGADVRFFVARAQGTAVACGALRLCTAYGEVKRMYVRPDVRGRGIGAALLARLEQCARAAGLPLIRLETGIAQPEALALYARAGFRVCEPFADYTPDPLSRFLEKRLD